MDEWWDDESNSMHGWCRHHTLYITPSFRFTSPLLYFLIWDDVVEIMHEWRVFCGITANLSCLLQRVLIVLHVCKVKLLTAGYVELDRRRQRYGVRNMVKMNRFLWSLYIHLQRSLAMLSRSTHLPISIKSCVLYPCHSLAHHNGEWTFEGVR